MASPAPTGAPGLAFRRLLAYALPAFALAIPTIPVYVYLPTYYAETVGVPLVAIGLALLAARLLDVVSDPLIGWISDRLGARGLGRFGRRKPVILLGAPLAGLALIQLFVPPADAGALYLGIWAALLYFGWTLVSLPYLAWGAELSPAYHARSRITGAREALSLLGILAAGAVPFLLGDGSGESAGGRGQSMAAIAWIAVGAGAAFLALALVTVPDAPVSNSLVADSRVDARSRLRRLFAGAAMARNKPFLRLVGAWAVNGLANGFPAVLFPLFVTEVLRLPEGDRNTLILVYFAAAILAVPAWTLWSRRVEKHRAWCHAMVLALATFAVAPFLGAGDFWPFLAICVATGAALGADLALPPSMQADVVDFGAWKSGREQAGLYFAIWSMVTKLAVALAVGIAFPVLALVGFEVGGVGAGGVNAGPALVWLAVLYALVPVALKLVAMALVWNYPLTEARHGVLRRRLAARRTRRGDQLPAT